MAERKRKNILFLCTGNYYRSRFAEVYFNFVAAKMGLAWQASSKGLALERGLHNVGPMAVSAVAALEALGVRAGDAITRFPATVTVADLEYAERIVALKHAEHLPLVQERFPDWAEKIEFWHVEDEPGVLPLIEQEVTSLIARILGGGGAGRESPAPTPPLAAPPAKKPITAKVGRETKGRRGKGVTTVSELALDEAALLELAGTLKQKCGTGGTVKDGRIEIQGDQRDRIATVLESMGYKVKRSGG